ncbi:MAG: ABC transporter ATP-binding protein [Planctomycetes bacterium]|nr:ABC transporter ATP-binding protein [Planctomycetota bacterium]
MSPRIEVSHATKVYTTSSTERTISIARAFLWGDLKNRTQVSSRVAVDDVSLSIQSGERVGIIGRNGAGKSTLVHLIAGLTDCTGGEVRVQGRVTAVMTLGLGLREDLTGRENIYLDGEVQGRTRGEVEQVIEEIIQFAELGEFIDYPLRTYSTGMKARLAFSMLVHIQPEILIIDEILAVGDAKFSSKAQKKFLEICERGMIHVLVSHSMASIVEMCSRCLWMEKGRVIMDGDPAAVTEAYLESVRRDEEGQLKKIYRQFVRAESFGQGCQVSRIDVTYAGESEPRNIVEAHSKVEFHVELEIGDGVEMPDAIIRWTRGDGLLLDERRVAEFLDGSARRQPRKFLVLQMFPLILAAGVYVVEVSLVSGNQVLARRSTIFEVTVRVLPIGGRPILLFDPEWEVESK